MRLGRDFFTRASDVVARDLLGSTVVITVDGQVKAGTIIETESYGPFSDPAFHAHNGRRTPRTEVLFGQKGVLYVYLIYGRYWQLNITAGLPESIESVFIRALHADDAPLPVNGPAKLCAWLGITGAWNGIDCCTDARLWIENGAQTEKGVCQKERVGVARGLGLRRYQLANYSPSLPR